MNLGNRETAARRDAQLRGAEAFMAGELDDAHPCLECEVRALRAVVREVATVDRRSAWKRLHDAVERYPGVLSRALNDEATP